MQTGYKKLIPVLITLNVMILLFTSMYSRQRQKEAHAREVEKERVEQLKEDFQLFEQENEVILRTVLHDLQTLDNEFKKVEHKEKNNNAIRKIEKLINNILSSENTVNLKKDIIRATDLREFETCLAMYNRGTVRIQQDIQMHFTKLPPAIFFQIDIPKGDRLQDSIPIRKKTASSRYSGRINGLSVGFKKLFPRFYQLLEERDFKLQIIRGAGLRRTSYTKDQGLDNNRLHQVHFEQEYFMKAPTQTTNIITSLRLTVTYNVDEQKLDIKFDYHGLPI